jgi:hypothetical protein
MKVFRDIYVERATLAPKCYHQLLSIAQRHSVA